MKKNPDEIPSMFGYKPLTVLTNSMQPKIDAGDMIFIQEIPTENIKVGDVITFKETETKLITHRVIEKTNEGFVTKGDNNNVKDQGIVAPKAVVGKLAVTIPKAGYIAKFASSPIGMFLMIIFPLLALAFIEIYERISKFIDRKEGVA